MMKSRNNWRTSRPKGCLIRHREGFASGCLIAIVVVVVILVGAGIYVATNFKDWAAEGVAVAMALVIDESALPEQEKSEIITILGRLKEDFKMDAITLEELGLILQAMENCPALAIGMMTQFEASYVEPSGLNDGEKIEAALILNRFAQGLAGGLISWEDTGAVIEGIMTLNDEGNQTIKEPNEVTDDEVRQVLAAAEQTADDAGIPEEKIDIDISDEFQKTIEEALGRSLWE